MECLKEAKLSIALQPKAGMLPPASCGVVLVDGIPVAEVEEASGSLQQRQVNLALGAGRHRVCVRKTASPLYGALTICSLELGDEIR